jgi:transcriptional regulator with XRE-family HTH domain
MEEAGQKLKRVRERLGLRYRDVEEFSQRISDRWKNNEFTIALSRLADIENRGTVPTMYRLYSLCAIYRLDLTEVLSWYGIEAAQLPAEASLLGHARTHLMGFTPAEAGGVALGDVQVPLTLDPGFDWRKTTFLSRLIQNWGTLPLMLVRGLESANHRYGFVGTEDWFMAPLLLPGSFVLVDESRCKITNSGWTSEFERPIFFLEHREGFACAWCSLQGDQIILQPHPSSPASPMIFPYPSAVEIIGQVVGVAMRLDSVRRRSTRS